MLQSQAQANTFS